MIGREGNFSFSFFYNEQIQEKCYFLNLLITDKHYCHATAWCVIPQPPDLSGCHLSVWLLLCLSHPHTENKQVINQISHIQHTHTHTQSLRTSCFLVSVLFLDRSCLELTSTDKNNPPPPPSISCLEVCLFNYKREAGAFRTARQPFPLLVSHAIPLMETLHLLLTHKHTTQRFVAAFSCTPAFRHECKGACRVCTRNPAHIPPLTPAS